MLAEVSASGRVSPPQEFVEALLSLRSAPPEPGIELQEVPAPRKIAPYAAALRAFTEAEEDELPVATGRFVVLFDPDGQPGWNSRFRIIMHARSQVEPEMGSDPLLGEVVWSWAHDALDDAGANAHNMNGTVTRELSDTFGGLKLSGSEVEIEMRASWSPATNDLGPHMAAWLKLIARTAGTYIDDDHAFAIEPIPHA
ncbi:DUF3000 domain-containing protein [Actinomyces urinae]|uniref:DUF3000 domain-containing protein n=1 Tax=Actinomyces urinae TaxID=1689268 RepID=UPI0009301FB8|nr:DUF3000 domain-containing protein [Actinomyces urinae]